MDSGNNKTQAAIDLINNAASTQAASFSEQLLQSARRAGISDSSMDTSNFNLDNVDSYKLLAMEGNTNYSGKGLSEEEKIIASMSPTELAFRYPELAARYASKLEQAREEFEVDSTTSRTAPGAIKDTAVGAVTTALAGVNTLAGTAIAGTGWALEQTGNETLGEIGEGLKNFGTQHAVNTNLAQQAVNSALQSETYKRQQRLKQVRRDALSADLEVERAENIAAGMGSITAGLTKFGTQLLNETEQYWDDKSALVDDAIQSLPSFLAAGIAAAPTKKLVGAYAEKTAADALQKAGTTVAAGVSARAALAKQAKDAIKNKEFNALVAANKKISRAESLEWPVGIAGLMASSGFTNTAVEIEGMTHAQLNSSSKPYRDIVSELVTQGVLEEEAHARAKARIQGNAAIFSAAVSGLISFPTGWISLVGSSRWLQSHKLTDFITSVAAKEPIANAWQEAGDQWATNIAIKKYADENRDTSHMVSERGAQGAMVGVGMAGMMGSGKLVSGTSELAAPALKAAASGVKSVASEAANVVTDVAGDRFATKADKANPLTPVGGQVAQTTVLENKESISKSYEDTITDSVVESLNQGTQTPQTKEELRTHFDTLVNASESSSVDTTHLSESSKKIIGGTKTVAEAYRKLEKAWERAKTPAEKADYLEALVEVHGKLIEAQSAGVALDNHGVLAALPAETLAPVKGLVESLHGIANSDMSKFLNDPSYLEVEARINQRIADGQVHAHPAASAMALHFPGSITSANLNTVIEGSPKGNVTNALKAQLSLLQQIEAILPAERLAEDGKTSSQVAREILTRSLDGESNKGSKKKRSVAGFLTEIGQHYSRGEVEKAEAALEHLGMFATHMANKVAALEESKSKNGEVVPYNQLIPGKLEFGRSDDAKSSSKHKGMRYEDTEGGRAFYARVKAEAALVAGAYEAIAEALGVEGTTEAETETLSEELVGELVEDSVQDLNESEDLVVSESVPTEAELNELAEVTEGNANKSEPESTSPSSRNQEESTNATDANAQKATTTSATGSTQKVFADAINRLLSQHPTLTSEPAKAKEAITKFVNDILMNVSSVPKANDIAYMLESLFNLIGNNKEIQDHLLTEISKRILPNLSKHKTPQSRKDYADRLKLIATWLKDNHPELLKEVEAVSERALKGDLEVLHRARNLDPILHNGNPVDTMAAKSNEILGPVWNRSILAWAANSSEAPNFIELAEIIKIAPMYATSPEAYSLVQQGKIKEALKTIYEDESVNPAIRAQAKAIADIFQTSRIPYPKVIQRILKEVGMYYAADHTITIGEGSSIGVLLHELGHALTLKGLGELLTNSPTEIQKGVNNLTEILMEALTSNPKLRERIKSVFGGDVFIYGTSNVYEALAEVINPVFAQILGEIKFDKSKLTAEGKALYEKYLAAKEPSNLLELVSDLVHLAISWISGKKGVEEGSLQELQELLFGMAVEAYPNRPATPGTQVNSVAEIKEEAQRSLDAEHIAALRERKPITPAQSKQLLSNGLVGSGVSIGDMFTYVNESLEAKYEELLKDENADPTELVELEEQLLASRSALAGIGNPIEVLEAFFNSGTHEDFIAISRNPVFRQRGYNAEAIKELFSGFITEAKEIKSYIESQILDEVNAKYDELINKQNSNGNFTRTPREKVFAGKDDRFMYFVEFVEPRTKEEKEANTITRANGKPFVKKIVRLKPGLVDNVALAAMQWVVNDSNSIREFWPEEMEQLLGESYYNIPQDIKNALNTSQILNDAITTIASKGRAYSGLLIREGTPAGVVSGMFGSVAVLALDALANRGLVEFVSTTIREDMSQGAQIVNEDGTLKPNPVKKVLRGIRPADSKQIKEARGAFQPYAELVDQLVLGESSYQRYVGDIVPEASTTQLNNKYIRLNGSQQASVNNANQTVHLLNEQFLDLVESIVGTGSLTQEGLAELGSLFGIGKITPTTTNYIKQQIEGQLTSLRTAIEEARIYRDLIKEISESTGTPLNEVPVRFANEITRVTRMQQSGRATPQSSKLMRHILLPTRATMDGTNTNHVNTLYAAIAQSVFDQKIGRKQPVEWTKAMKDYMNSPKIVAITDYITRTQNGIEKFNVAHYNSLVAEANKGAPFKIEQTELALFTLMEFARIREDVSTGSSNIETSIYIEQDGINNGILNAIMGMSVGPDSGEVANFLRALRAGGVSIAQYADAAQLFGELGTDLYGLSAETYASSYNEYLDNLILDLADPDDTAKLFNGEDSGKTNAQVLKEVAQALDRVMDNLMKGFTANDKDGRTLKRDAVKYRSMERIYGSGLLASARGDFTDMMDVFYQRLNEAREASKSNNPAPHLLWIRELAPFMDKDGNIPEDIRKEYAQKTENLLKDINTILTARVIPTSSGVRIKITKPFLNPKKGGLSWGNSEHAHLNVLHPNFKFSEWMRKNAIGNIQTLYSQLVRKSIDNVLGSGVTDSLELLKDVTNKRSVLFAELVKLRIDAKLAEVKETSKGRNNTHFLSREEMREILNDPLVKQFFPELTVEKRKFLLAKFESLVPLPSSAGARTSEHKLGVAKVGAPVESTAAKGAVKTGARDFAIEVEHSEKSFGAIGVGGMANTNIGIGDAMMVENFYQQVREGILQVFDGFNINMADAFNVGTELNQAQAEAWLSNPMESIYKIAQGNVKLAEVYEKELRAFYERSGFDLDALMPTDEYYIPMFDYQSLVISPAKAEVLIKRDPANTEMLRKVQLNRLLASNKPNTDAYKYAETQLNLSKGQKGYEGLLAVFEYAQAAQSGKELVGPAADFAKAFGIWDGDLSLDFIKFNLSKDAENAEAMSRKRQAFLNTLDKLGFTSDQMSALNTPTTMLGTARLSEHETVEEAFTRVYNHELDKLSNVRTELSSLQKQLIGDRKIGKGVTVAYFSHAKQFLKNSYSGLSAEQRKTYEKLFKIATNKNAPTFIVGTPGQAVSYLKRRGIQVSNLSTQGAYIVSPDGSSSYIYIGPDATLETLIHEIDHYAQFAGMLNIASAPKGTHEAALAAHMDVLLNDVVNLTQEDINSMTPEQRTAYEDFMAEISSMEDSEGNLLYNKANKTPMDKARLYSELSSWGLTNRDLAKFLKGRSNERISKSHAATKGAFTQLIEKLDKFLRKVFEVFFKSSEAGNNFFDSLSLTSSVVATIGRSSPLGSIMQENAGTVQLNHNSASQRSTDALREALNDKAKTYTVDAAREAEINNLVNTATNSFGFSPEQAQTYKNMQILLTSNGAIDSVTLAYLNAIKTEAIRHLTPEMITGGATDAASMAHGKILLGKLFNMQDPVEQSAAFLTLATISDNFRAGLSQLSIKSNTKAVDMDSTLSFIANSVMDRAFKLTSGIDATDGVSLIDTALTRGVVAQEAQSRDLLELPADVIGALDAKFTSFVRDIFDGEKIKQMAKDRYKNKGDEADVISRAGMAIGLLFSSIQKGEIGDDVLVSLSRVQKRFQDIPVLDQVFGSLAGLAREFTGVTLDNAAIYDMIKKVTYLIDTTKKRYKEMVPNIIREKFNQLTKEEESTLSDIIRTAGIAGVVETLGADDAIASILNKGQANNSYQIQLSNLMNTIGNSQVVDFIDSKVKQLVNFNRTQVPGTYLLQNAEAIANGLGTKFNLAPIAERLVPIIRDMIALQSIDSMTQQEMDAFTELYDRETEGVTYLVRQIEITQVEENQKRDTRYTKYNASYGFMPVEVKVGRDVVIAKDSERSRLENLGYTKGESIEDGLGYSYYYTQHNPQATYGKGILQIIRKTKNGVDENSGNSVDPMRNSIVDPTEVLMLRKKYLADPSKFPNLIPIHSSAGEIIGFDRVLTSDMRNFLLKDVSVLDSLGTWQSRQIEESLADSVNDSLIDRVWEMWDASSESERKSKAFIDISDPSKLTPVERDALSLVPVDVMRKLEAKFDGGPIMVRADMFIDVFGRREASITDFFTGNTNWSPQTQAIVKGFLGKILGDNAVHKLFTFDAGLRGVVNYARHTIVIASVVVPAINAVSSLAQLGYNNVSPLVAVREWPRKLREAEFYTNSIKREVELEADIKVTPDGSERNRLMSELRSLRDAQRKLSIWPLIEAGEMNTIADLGLTGEEGKLLNGKAGEWLEEKANQMSPRQRALMRQGLVTRDTALYKGMEKLTLYGDFIAKSILYDKLMQKDGMTSQQAISYVSEEYVNYDRLSGRTRNVLENYGLLWFGNFKLRSVRSTLRAMKRNPLQMLAMSYVPMPFGVSTSVQDNWLARILTDRVSGVGPGFMSMALTLNPYVQLTGMGR